MESSCVDARLMGLDGTARYLGVTSRSVLRLAERGTLTPIRLPGFRRILFDVRDLETLIQSAKAQGESTAAATKEPAGVSGR